MLESPKDLLRYLESIGAVSENTSNSLVLAGSKKEPEQKNIVDGVDTNIYLIKVKAYMTKPSSREFNFHEKWNSNSPMPLRIMVGSIIGETKGMYKMQLHGQRVEKMTQYCCKCGRTITNPVSKILGVGPECGGHNYTNPFNTEQELKEAVANIDEELRKITWEGWVIKSAIEIMDTMWLIPINLLGTSKEI